MKLENQVSNKDLSLRLKELGVTQLSIWHWVHPWERTRFVVVESVWILTTEYLETRINGRQTISAFTSDELGQMLPYFDGRIQMPWKNEDGCRSHYQTDPSTEADSRAKMLIHLIESKIITVEQVNERLAA